MNFRVLYRTGWAYDVRENFLFCSWRTYLTGERADVRIVITRQTVRGGEYIYLLGIVKGVYKWNGISLCSRRRRRQVYTTVARTKTTRVNLTEKSPSEKWASPNSAVTVDLRGITHGFYFMLRKQNLEEPRAVVYLRRDRVGLNAGKRGGTNKKIEKKISRH